MAVSASAEPTGGVLVPAPVPYRVRSRAQETADTWTLELDPLADAVRPRAGQFDMLFAFGVGEVPISTSGEHESDGSLTHTIRAVGPVTRALCALDEEAVLGVRGPFGNEWPLAGAVGGDLLVVAGGIGLAPLRPAIRHALAHRGDYGSVAVLLGARTPADLLFVSEVEEWRSRLDAEIDVTVDAAAPGWHGRVGLVTTLIPGAVVDPATATAFVCGPEIMMTFVVRALLERGLPIERIWLSLERNMRCGVGHCGHCQLGPVLICRDGPVFRADEMTALMEVREL
jgi:NAD(P)H-flavin reductase